MRLCIANTCVARIFQRGGKAREQSRRVHAWGRVREFKNVVSINGGGGGGGACALVPLSYARWQWCSQDLSPSGGGKAGSDRAGEGEGGVGPPTVYREIFWKFVCENSIFLHIINAISLCSGIDQ